MSGKAMAAAPPPRRGFHLVLQLFLTAGLATALLEMALDLRPEKASCISPS